MGIKPDVRFVIRYDFPALEKVIIRKRDGQDAMERKVLSCLPMIRKILKSEKFLAQKPVEIGLQLLRWWLCRNVNEQKTVYFVLFWWKVWSLYDSDGANMCIILQIRLSWKEAAIWKRFTQLIDETKESKV